MPTAAAVTVVPVSSFPPADLPLDGTEIVGLVKDGTSQRATTQDIASLGGGGAVAFTGFRAVAVAAGQTNNWAPNIADIARLEVTAAGAAIVTGLAGGTDGRYMVVTNVGVQDLTLYAESGASTAANRFAMNGDAFLQAGWSASFIYSAALSRWTRVG